MRTFFIPLPPQASKNQYSQFLSRIPVWTQRTSFVDGIGKGYLAFDRDRQTKRHVTDKTLSLVVG